MSDNPVFGTALWQICTIVLASVDSWIACSTVKGVPVLAAGEIAACWVPPSTLVQDLSTVPKYLRYAVL